MCSPQAYYECVIIAKYDAYMTLGTFGTVRLTSFGGTDAKISYYHAIFSIST